MSLDNRTYLHLYSFSKMNQKKIYCYLEENFRINLFKKFKKHYSTIVNASRLLKVSEDKIRGWITGRNVRGIKHRIIPVQASILFQIAKGLNLGFNLVEKKIIAIKTDANSHLLKNPILPIRLNYPLGRLLGMSLGDGHLTKNSTIVYSNTSKILIEEAVDCINSLGMTNFKVSPTKDIIYLIIPNVIGIILNELGAFRGNKAKNEDDVRFNKNIKYYPSEFKLGLLSGLIDDEGSVIKDGKIYFEQRLPHIVNGTKNLLNEFGIETSEMLSVQKRKRHYFYVYKKSERKKVLDLDLLHHPSKQERLVRIVQEDSHGRQ